MLKPQKTKQPDNAEYAFWFDLRRGLLQAAKAADEFRRGLLAIAAVIERRYGTWVEKGDDHG